MSPVLALICIWAFIFSVYNLSTAIKTIFAGDFKKFGQAFGMFVPFSIVWTDAFLRIFTPSHTGLW